MMKRGAHSNTKEASVGREVIFRGLNLVLFEAQTRYIIFQVPFMVAFFFFLKLFKL